MERKTRNASALGRVAGLAALLWFVPATSFAAEPTAEDRGLAEALFRDAKALMDGGREALACPKLAESHRLDPKPGTMLNLAVCHEKTGRTASAWSDYLEAAMLASRVNQKEREAFARDRAAALEKSLARLSVRVSAKVPGLSVTIDGREWREAAWGTAAPIDPGEHVAEVSAPGYVTWSEKVKVEPGPGARELLVPALLPSSGAETTPPGPTPPPDLPTGPRHTPKNEASVAPPPNEGVPGRLVAGVAVGAVGLAGLVVGSIYGLRTFSKRDEGNTFCVAPAYVLCDAQGFALHEEAETSATVSTIGFGVGVVGLGVGLVLALTARGSSQAPAKARPSAAFFVPVVDRGGAGASFGFSF